MTKEEFEAVKALYAESGQPLKSFLQEIGVSYTTYHYWERKTRHSVGETPMAPITIMEQTPAVTENRPDPETPPSIPTGVTVAFPNGLRAHFGQGSEDILMELFTQSLPSHVLPQ